MNLILKRIEPAVLAIRRKGEKCASATGWKRVHREKGIRIGATSWEAERGKKRKTMVRTLISENERLGVGKERKRRKSWGRMRGSNKGETPGGARARKRAQSHPVSAVSVSECENPGTTGGTAGKGSTAGPGHISCLGLLRGY